MQLDIVVPVLNEAAGIAATLDRLQPMRARGARVTVVDGGSSDATLTLAADRADRVLVSGRGRALQMNAGARDALAHHPGDVLLFLHADTVLPDDADRLIGRALGRRERVWGRFDVRIDGRARVLPLVAALMNLRSRLTGIATGDQAIFVERGAWLALQGFAPIALMEDIEFTARARTLSRPAVPAAPATTSGRRWDRDGVWRTILTMWRLRLAYWLGAEPTDLARRYRDVR